MEKAPIVVCSLGDAAVTEGEVSEALQMAALRKLPILFFIRTMNGIFPQMLKKPVP
jgi:2-oxoisovalerate dehydrogenase E1 component